MGRVSECKQRLMACLQLYLLFLLGEDEAREREWVVVAVLMSLVDVVEGLMDWLMEG